MSVEELLAAYATGELEGEERERVESALEESPRLR
nr:zf-HC2 domain-containing protein [Rubrobacter sp.]